MRPTDRELRTYELNYFRHARMLWQMDLCHTLEFYDGEIRAMSPQQIRKNKALRESEEVGVS